MQIEHLGIQVADPVAMASWWVEQLGFTVQRRMDGPPHIHFLADASGRMMIEIQRNPAAPVPDYRSQNPVLLHVAFHVADVERERKRLLTAGAKAEGDVARLDSGDVIAMLRDPWGFPFQLVHRATPMV